MSPLCLYYEMYYQNMDEYYATNVSSGNELFTKNQNSIPSQIFCQDCKMHLNLCRFYENQGIIKQVY